MHFKPFHEFDFVEAMVYFGLSHHRLTILFRIDHHFFRFQMATVAFSLNHNDYLSKEIYTIFYLKKKSDEKQLICYTRIFCSHR